MRERARVPALLLFMLVAGYAITAAVNVLAGGRTTPVDVVSAPGVKQWTGQSTLYRATLDGGEAFTDFLATSGHPSTAASVTTISCGGFAEVTVWAEHSASAATVACTAVRYMVPGTGAAGTDAAIWEEAGATNFTLTAGTTFTAGSAYPSTACTTLKTHGAQIMKVYAADPSSGSVSIMYTVH